MRQENSFKKYHVSSIIMVQVIHIISLTGDGRSQTVTATHNLQNCSAPNTMRLASAFDKVGQKYYVDKLVSSKREAFYFTGNFIYFFIVTLYLITMTSQDIFVAQLLY